MLLDAFPGKFTETFSVGSFCSFPVSVHLFPSFRCQKVLQYNYRHPHNALLSNYVLSPIVDGLLVFHQIQCTSSLSSICKILFSPSDLRNGLHFKTKFKWIFHIMPQNCLLIATTTTTFSKISIQDSLKALKYFWATEDNHLASCLP